MNSLQLREVTFCVPVWSVEVARKKLNCWDISYEEKNYLIFTNFIVTVRAKPSKAREIMDSIAEDLKELCI